MTKLSRAAGVALALALTPVAAGAQDGPLRLTITDGVIEPMPIAVPPFLGADPAAAGMAAQVTQVVIDDLEGTGLFRAIPPEAHVTRVSSFESPVQFSDWQAIDAQALVTGAVQVQGDRVVVQFRLWDVFAGQPLGEGLQFAGTVDGWRRAAHKVADAVYSRITGEDPYFDSRVAFVSETGPKSARLKRLAVMDYDGANLQYLTSSDSLVLAPRFSPDGRSILYTSYETGFPRVTLLDVATLGRRTVGPSDANMSFSPRFSPDGGRIVYAAEVAGNTDLYLLDLASGATARLTTEPSIETGPSFSPDGRSVTFDSDRSGTAQIYVMPASGGPAQRISRGAGRYTTPVWSPRGDLIAFTKQNAGRFHIGVMRVDGSEERLLTGSFLDEGPTWSPNGRVLMFTRESPGALGAPALYSADITGQITQAVPTPGAASDPSWGPLLN